MADAERSFSKNEGLCRKLHKDKEEAHKRQMKNFNDLVDKKKTSEGKKKLFLQQTSLVEGKDVGDELTTGMTSKSPIQNTTKRKEKKITEEPDKYPICITLSSFQKAPVKSSTNSFIPAYNGKKQSMKNKNVNEKKLQENRHKEREKKRRQREKLRQSPEAYEVQKQKERERYIRRKNQGKLKSINQMTQREQRLQRKRWKINIKRFRARKIEAKLLKENCPSDSLLEKSQLAGYSSIKKRAGRKKIRREKTASYQALQKSKLELNRQKARAERYKKRCQRLTNKKISPSPRKKVSMVMSHGNQAIKKRLLFGEALEAQLISKSKNLQSPKEKQIFSKCVSGTILKKYRVGNQASTFISPYQNRKNIESASLKYFRKKKRNSLQVNLKKAVINFFENDDNSCIAPGKKDFITQNKVKRQKRYLMHSLETLYKKFLKSSQFQLSYVSFTRLRPFWVVTPKVSGRDTCLCTKHENFKYIITKLHQIKIIKQSSTQDLCTSLCCSTKNKECMYSQCKRCETKKIVIEEGYDKKAEPTFYYQWVNKKEERIGKKEKKIKVKFINKDKFICTVDELICKANEALPKFLKHAYNVTHQFEKCKQLKELLNTNEVLILIDFSENYICKYEKEVQSAHFGAAKKQLTLHTGVIYYVKVQEGNSNKLNCISFCSVSENLLHNACAVWAHLQPVLQVIKQELPNVNIIHFQSDGPTTQYRNRTNFFLFRYFCDLLGLEAATWNFTEAGHGKGSADGIGGVVKRVADQDVAHGKDISNIQMFIDALQNKDLKVRLFNITDTEINNIKALIPSNLKPVPNMMKLHQLVWSKGKKWHLGLRELSCITCGTELTCPHYMSDPATVDLTEYSKTDLLLKKIINTEITQEKINVGQWVAVIYDNNWYPGVVDSVDGDALSLSFMSRSGDKFYWPEKLDKQTVPENEILSIIDAPPIPISSRYYIIADTDKINKLCSDLLS